jgi:SAM-dependent methyltransferase
MDDVTHATPLYEFLRQCNSSALEKIVLDCGAGGEFPPLSLFHHYGYQTYGIEIDESSLLQAVDFCNANGMELNIFRGDMRRIPFAGESFSFVYTYNAIMFMTKPDIAIVMKEIERVLRTGGLCFVNFMSVDDPDRTPFSETSPLRPLLGSERFACYEDNEADPYFEHFQITRKEKRLLEKLTDYGMVKQAYIDYIARKR